jgi:hypothetical protein
MHACIMYVCMYVSICLNVSMFYSIIIEMKHTSDGFFVSSSAVDLHMSQK